MTDIKETEGDARHIADRIIEEIIAQPIEERRAERLEVLKARYGGDE